MYTGDDMDVKRKLFNKNGMMVTNLAKEFISLEEGDRIATVAEISSKYKTARGTIQSALKFIVSHGGIFLESRGHMGTFIIRLDYLKLLELADISFMVGVMPLPYTKRYEGLATGLYNSELADRFSLNLAYMRGAKKRLESLLQGRYDFAVMSEMAAKEFIKQGINIERVLNFGKDSFVTDHVLLFHNPSSKGITEGMKVGIDSSSLDHEMIIHSIIKDLKVELVDLPYNMLKNKLIMGEIDATLITLDELEDSKFISNYILVDSLINDHINTEAVIVVRGDRKEVGSILRKFISVKKILELQKDVINNKIIPNY